MTPSRTPRPRVLLIEADEDIQYVLKEALIAEGYTVTPAIDGYDGISKAADVKPDLVVLDLKTPGVGIAEYVGAFRRRLGDPSIPLILMGTFAPSALAVECADSYLQKPIDLHQLLLVIQQFIALKTV